MPSPRRGRPLPPGIAWPAYLVAEVWGWCTRCGYETSARFTRFLIDRFGLDQYFALFVALDGKQGLDAIAAGVQTVLGTDFMELNAEFKTVNCAIDRWRFYDYECSALPLTPWDNETRWSTDIDLTCANDDVLGPRQGVERRCAPSRSPTRKPAPTA